MPYPSGEEQHPELVAVNPSGEYGIPKPSAIGDRAHSRADAVSAVDNPRVASMMKPIPSVAMAAKV